MASLKTGHFVGPVKEKKGYTLEDQALRWASSRGTMMTLFYRFVRWCTDRARWADPLYIKADIWSRYGKPKDADHFWEEWAPEKGKRI